MKNNFEQIATLVKRLKASDQTAFPTLYGLTYQRIYFLCHSILKNEEDAKDAVQETYIKILVNISTLQNDRLFIAWANKIAYSVCMRMLAKNKDEPTEDAFLNAISDDSPSNSPYAVAEKSERSEILSELIDALDPILRSTLIFKYFNDLKIKQIAVIMDCPEGTVKSRLNTAKRLLKSAIENKRQGDVLFSIFTFIPLQKALTLSAARSFMPPAVAELALNGAAAEGGLHGGLSFVAQPAAKPIPFPAAPVAAAAGCTATAAAAVTLSAVISLAPPAIRNVVVHQPAMGYTNEAVAITATVNAPLQSIEEVYLLSDSGSRIDGCVEHPDLVRFNVRKNGAYTICAVSSNGLTETAALCVTAIDTQAPTVTGYTYTAEELVFTLEDACAGIDFSSLRGETASGNVILPLFVDEAANTATFPFPSENYELIVKDRAGNISYHKVERIQK